MENTNWSDSLKNIKDDYSDYLSRLKHEEYVGFCLKNKHLRKFTEDYLNKIANRKKPYSKDAKVAIDKKNAGNEKFKEKKLEQSLSLYTQSIFHAPQNDETLPLAYSNRSLVLFQMEKFTECIQDTEMALSTGYDVEKAWKLMLRKAECLANLGHFQKAKEILAECAEKPHDKRIFQNVSNEITKLECGEEKKVSRQIEFQLPELAGGENKNFISASNYIGAYYSKSRGRHVLATHDIDIGDVLFVEKAYTFILMKKACHRCCTKTSAPIPCLNCTEVAYCSPACRDKDWDNTHQYECGYHEALKFLGIAHLSLKIALAAAPKFEDFKKILNNIRVYNFEEGPISLTNGGYEDVYNLITHTDKYGTSDLFQFVMSAILLTLHMKRNTNYFPKTSTEDDLKLFASAVWRHIMQMICNCYAIVDCFNYTKDAKLVVTATEEQLGSAVYPSACIMNHSCEPPVIYSFYKDYFIIRAAKMIRKGEEVTSCYGAYVKFMNKRDRQEILTKQYFFDCECYHCSQTFDTQEKFRALKCSGCKGPLLPKGKVLSLFWFCLDCCQITEIDKVTLEKSKMIDDLFAEGLTLMEKDVQSALMKFLACWRLAREIFYKFHEDVMLAADQVALCLIELKDYRKAAMFLKCCMISVEERFGKFSIEVAGESAKFGDVLLQCSCHCTICEDDEKKEKARQGVEWYARAERIYSRLYGPYYHELDKIRENREKLEAFCAGELPPTE